VLIYCATRRGVPVAPLPGTSLPKPIATGNGARSASARRSARPRLTSIRHLTSSTHDYKGLSGFGIEIVSTNSLSLAVLFRVRCRARPRWRKEEIIQFNCASARGFN